MIRLKKKAEAAEAEETARKEAAANGMNVDDAGAAEQDQPEDVPAAGEVTLSTSKISISGLICQTGRTKPSPSVAFHRCDVSRRCQAAGHWRAQDQEDDQGSFTQDTRRDQNTEGAYRSVSLP